MARVPRQVTQTTQVPSGPSVVHGGDVPEHSTRHFDAPRVTNLSQEVPQLQVESLEHLGSMLELDVRLLDPNFKYRWVHKSPIKVARAKSKGYKFCDPDSEDIKNVVGDSPEAEDGTITVGDLVLMRTPRTLYKARRKRIRIKGQQRLKGPIRKFRKEAQKASARYAEPVRVITDEE